MTKQEKREIETALINAYDNTLNEQDIHRDRIAVMEKLGNKDYHKELSSMGSEGIIKAMADECSPACSQDRHTVKYLGISPEIKRQALQLYLEGLGFRSIGRFLNCSHVAVYNWIKAHGESIEPLRSEKEIEIVELDEMHTYIGSKKTIAGSGLLLIAMEKDFSTAKWAPATRPQGENYGKPLKTKTGEMS